MRPPPAHWLGGAAVIVASLLGSATAELSYRTHWLGHTGADAPAQSTVTCLAVAPDGTCIVGARSMAGVPSVALYRDGSLVGRADLPGPGFGGGTAVAVSEIHIFLAVTLTGGRESAAEAVGGPAVYPPGGTAWHGVWRFARAGQHAPFPGGRGPGGALCVVHESADPAAAVSAVVAGLWVHEGELFVSDAAANLIRVYDEVTLAEKRAFRATQPGALCVLAGRLQVIERGAVVTAFTLGGQRTGQVLDEGDDLLPDALAPSPEGRLLVSDLAESQQIHFFNMSGVPTRVRTLGEENGMYGPPTPGEAGPRRLAGIVGVGTDAAGNSYVAMDPPPGGCVLRSFGPDRKSLRWQSLAVGVSHGADTDPLSDGFDIFTTEGRHALDLTKPTGQSWRWVAQSVNPFRYPLDPRLGGIGGWQPPSETARTHRASPLPYSPGRGAIQTFGGTTTFREIDGRKFLIHRAGGGSSFVLYRLQGNTAVPAIIINGEEKPVSAFALPHQPARGRWIWRDTDGDGQSATGEFATAPSLHGRFPASPIDAEGGLWMAANDGTIQHWPCRGIDNVGVPKYDDDPATSRQAPSGLRPPLELYYSCATEALYLAGTTTAASPDATLMATIVRLDAWSAASATHPRWQTAVPFNSPAAHPPSVSAAGDLVFALDPATSQVHVLGTDDGTPLGILRPALGNADAISSRHTAALRTHRRQDGSYLILTQDPNHPRALVDHLDDPLAPP